MGYVEDVEQQDQETVNALRAVRGAAIQDAHHPSVDSAKIVGNAAFHAQVEIDKEIHLLRRIERTLEDIKRDAASDYRSRRQSAVPAPGPTF